MTLTLALKTSASSPFQGEGTCSLLPERDGLGMRVEAVLTLTLALKASASSPYQGEGTSGLRPYFDPLLLKFPRPVPHRMRARAVPGRS